MAVLLMTVLLKTVNHIDDCLTDDCLIDDCLTDDCLIDDCLTDECPIDDGLMIA